MVISRDDITSTRERRLIESQRRAEDMLNGSDSLRRIALAGAFVAALVTLAGL